MKSFGTKKSKGSKGNHSSETKTKDITKDNIKDKIIMIIMTMQVEMRQTNKITKISSNSTGATTLSKGKSQHHQSLLVKKFLLCVIKQRFNSQ